MAGIFFWRKKRKDEPEVSQADFEELATQGDIPADISLDGAKQDATPTDSTHVGQDAIVATPSEAPPVKIAAVKKAKQVETAVAEQVAEEASTAAEAPAQVSEVVAEPEPDEVIAPEVEEVEELEPVQLPVRTFKRGIRSLFSRVKFDPENLDDLEDILLSADFGVDASLQIVEEVKARAKKTGASTEPQLKQILADIIRDQLEREDKALNLSDAKLPYVFLVVGVNGVGKTTTIGKLANWLSEGDWNVVIGAADTFRAAAVDQVATWAERAGAKIVKPKAEGQDPAAVAFESVELAIREDADIVIIDTAGRLQNKADLMQELDKIRRVVEKQAQISEVLLVLDATTGQNGLQQAKAFAEVAKVTGIVLTKLDGTAKGGIVYSIQQELGIPVKLVGVGEGINDFAFFDAEEFANGLVS